MAKNKEPKFIQIMANGKRVYALDDIGGVWGLDKFWDDNWKWLECVEERITENIAKKSLKETSQNNK